MEEQERQSEIEESELLKPKGLLYHYTTLDGFVGIVDSDSLRATHIRYMNDSKEFIDVLDHLDSLIDEFGEIVRLIEGPKEIVRQGLKRILQSSLAFFSGKNGAYVISFTDDEAQLTVPGQTPGDRLSQWRAYTANARGISLGFDYTALEKGGKDKVWFMQGSMAYLLYCVYSDHDKRVVFQNAEETFANRLTQIKAGIAISGMAEDPRVALIARSLAHEMIISATTFKNPAYFEEKEWRIVILPPRGGESSETTSPYGSGLPVRFRNGALGITPYVECPLGLRSPNSPLRRIVVGPTPHMEEAITAVEMLLEDKGVLLRSKDLHNGVEVVPSKIPYRNW
jgi:hypothetical protein